jgi:hypothetical protein
MMVILNIVLMALISIAIVGFVAWSICTRRRRSGYADLRIRRRLPRIIKLVSRDARELGRPATVAPEI